MSVRLTVPLDVEVALWPEKASLADVEVCTRAGPATNALPVVLATTTLQLTGDQPQATAWLKAPDADPSAAAARSRRALLKFRRPKT